MIRLNGMVALVIVVIVVSALLKMALVIQTGILIITLADLHMSNLITNLRVHHVIFRLRILTPRLLLTVSYLVPPDMLPALWNPLILRLKSLIVAMSRCFSLSLVPSMPLHLRRLLKILCLCRLLARASTPTITVNIWCWSRLQPITWSCA